MNKNIVLATGNQRKVRELSDILINFDMNIIPQTELGINSTKESGLTFVENALIKARHATKFTSFPVIADDSGILVDALGDAPGIYSARYAEINNSNKSNLQTLIDVMQNIPDAQRGATYHCVLIYLRYRDDPTPIVCHGYWKGVLIHKAVCNDGFGYDPIFYVPNSGKTAAAMTLHEKNFLSHRAQALNLLLDRLSDA